MMVMKEMFVAVGPDLAGDMHERVAADGVSMFLCKATGT